MKPTFCGVLMLLGLLTGCSREYTQTADTLDRAEKIVKETPDSALCLLQDIRTDALGNRSQRARYALLCAEASERAGLETDNDSLLRIAWNYYSARPNDIRGICKTRFFQGQNLLRRGDKPGALRMFLEIEEMLRPYDEPYYLGLLYLRIGGVYRAELNFVRAYRYYRDARDLFIRSGATRQTAEALLGMTTSALRMQDLGRARCDCTMALELADDLHDDTLVRQSLGLFATLYTVSENERIPNDLLQRVDSSPSLLA